MFSGPSWGAAFVKLFGGSPFPGPHPSEVAEIVTEAFRLVAPRRLVAELEGRG
jgi:hypothetical protein